MKFQAYIKRGEHIVKVINNKMLKNMFKVNTNIEGPIDIYADLDLICYVPPHYGVEKVVHEEVGNEETIGISSDEEDLVDAEVAVENELEVEVEVEVDVDEDVRAEEMINDRVNDSDVEVEVDCVLLSPTDDDDLTWGSCTVSTNGDDDNSLKEELDPELEDNDCSSEGMKGKLRRAYSDDEFVDPNRNMHKAINFVGPSGKK